MTRDVERIGTPDYAIPATLYEKIKMLLRIDSDDLKEQIEFSIRSSIDYILYETLYSCGVFDFNCTYSLNIERQNNILYIPYEVNQIDEVFINNIDVTNRDDTYEVRLKNEFTINECYLYNLCHDSLIMDIRIKLNAGTPLDELPNDLINAIAIMAQQYIDNCNCDCKDSQMTINSIIEKYNMRRIV